MLQLKEILQLPVLVVLDEAYIEFSDVPSKVMEFSCCCCGCSFP
jgi:histidinol-phosphate/aromatic aminotransferase/cobyric acid decarboxylase-like protein